MWRKPVGLGAMRTRTLIEAGIVGVAALSAPGARSAHTDGSERIIAQVVSITPSESHNVSVMPIAADNGPTTANPIGISTNEPSTS